MCIHVDRSHHHAWQPAHLLVGVLLLSLVHASALAAGQGDPQRGEQLYRRYCAICHGIEGTGTGRNAPHLEQMGRAPRDHTDSRYMNRLSETELYRANSEGKRWEGEPPFMPWWGYTVTEQDIWDLVTFIRGLRKEPVE
jgi:mono/diheme cytochrome c family protein